MSCVLFVLTVGFYIVVSRCTKEGHSCNVPFLSDACVLFFAFLVRALSLTAAAVQKIRRIQVTLLGNATPSRKEAPSPEVASRELGSTLCCGQVVADFKLTG